MVETRKLGFGLFCKISFFLVALHTNNFRQDNRWDCVTTFITQMKMITDDYIDTIDSVALYSMHTTQLFCWHTYTCHS